MLKLYKVYFQKELIGNFLTFNKTEALKVGKEVYATLNNVYDKNTLNPADFLIKEVYWVG